MPIGRRGGITIACLVVFAGAGVLALRESVFRLRQPTDLERFQYIAAVNLREPQLCERIDRLANAGPGWSTYPLEFRGERLRSKCFRVLAVALKDASLCARVEPISTVGMTGERLDESYCRQAMGSAGVSEGAAPDPHGMREFVGFMRQLGYGDREVVESQYQENRENSPAMAAFEEVRHDPAFLSKLRAGPGYDEAPSPGALRAARPLEVLYQAIAIDTREPAFCARVSPNATLADWGGEKTLVRSRCYVSIAYDTGEAGVCDRLPKKGVFPPALDQNDSAENCRQAVAAYQRTRRRDRLYGPLPFAHASDLGEALGTIGYASDAVTRASTPDPGQYWQFVSRLRFDGTPEARSEFVRRALTLR